MMRFALAFAVLVVAWPASRADLLAPGTRNLAIDHQFETDKEYPGWVFFAVRGSGGAEPVRLDPKTPAVLKGSDAVGRGPARFEPGGLGLGYRSMTLVAVPADAAAKYKADKDLRAAVEDGSVPGLVRVKGGLPDHENVKATDARKSITRRYKVAKVDAKEGIVVTAVEEPAPENESGESGDTTRNTFPWAAGAAVALAVALGGLWLVRRPRRGPAPPV